MCLAVNWQPSTPFNKQRLLQCKCIMTVEGNVVIWDAKKKCNYWFCLVILDFISGITRCFPSCCSRSCACSLWQNYKYGYGVPQSPYPLVFPPSVSFLNYLGEVYFRIINLWSCLKLDKDQTFFLCRSNCQYIWPWQDWAYVRDLPRWAPQRVFVQEVLERETRLSYWDKIKQVCNALFLWLIHLLFIRTSWLKTSCSI